MSVIKTANLEKKVTKTMRVGLKFIQTPNRTKKENILKAVEIIRSLEHESYKKLTSERVDQAIKFLREYPNLSGVIGSAKLRKKLKDCSNLGESPYLVLLQSVKGLLDREEKLTQFLKISSTYPSEELSWFIFGRSPLIERKLAVQLGCQREYARNLIYGARRRLNSFLSEKYHVNMFFSRFSYEELEYSLYAKYETLLQEQPDPQTWTKNFRIFIKKLRYVIQYRHLLLPYISMFLRLWNETPKTRPKSTWQFLKGLSAVITTQLGMVLQKQPKKASYQSVIRAILVQAFVDHTTLSTTVQELKQAQVLRKEHLISKPFLKTKKLHDQRLPLNLLMKWQYVVERPGNYSRITVLLKRFKQFPIHIYEPRKKKQAVPVFILAHHTIIDYLEQGAVVKGMKLTTTDAPSNKIICELALEGPAKVFVRTNEARKQTNFFPNVLRPVPTLGIDINRAGKHIVAFSEEFNSNPLLMTLCHKYQQLNLVIAQLHKHLTKVERQKWSLPKICSRQKYLKASGELHRVYQRQKRLLKEIKNVFVRTVATSLYQLQSDLLSVEQLNLILRGTSGALAKAIRSMPKDTNLVEEILIQASVLRRKMVSAIPVDPAYTSQGPHIDCVNEIPGTLQRTPNQWDIVRCSSCHQPVNSHINAAKAICQKGIHLASAPV